MEFVMNFGDYKHIKFERHEKVLVATLNRPDVRNAVDDDLHVDLVRLFYEVDKDRDTKVLVLTGAGKAFCAGGDIGYMTPSEKYPNPFEDSLKDAKRLVFNQLDCDKPVICRMNGDAVGLGATVALYCDIVIANETARIGDPHVRVGIAAGDGGTIIWPQLVGYARAKQYLLTGDLLTAKEAASIGLINFAVPEAELDSLVDHWAVRLANGASKAVNYTKAMINVGLKQLAHASMDGAIGLEVLSSHSKDHKEAQRAFRERRKPVFTGM